MGKDDMVPRLSSQPSISLVEAKSLQWIQMVCFFSNIPSTDVALLDDGLCKF
jgi:hypothetical protein